MHSSLISNSGRMLLASGKKFGKGYKPTSVFPLFLMNSNKITPTPSTIINGGQKRYSNNYAATQGVCERVLPPRITIDDFNNWITDRGIGNIVTINGRDNIILLKGSNNNASINGSKNLMSFYGSDNTFFSNGYDNHVLIQCSGFPIHLTGSNQHVEIDRFGPNNWDRYKNNIKSIVNTGLGKALWYAFLDFINNW